MKRKNKNPMANVYDLETHRVSTIPKAELAPGMIQVKIGGLAGMHWVNSAQWNPDKQPAAALRHPPFTGEAKADIEEIARSFPDVYDHGLTFWETGFRKDKNPLLEINLWRIVAEVYRERSTGKPLAYRQELFRLLQACFSAPPEDVLGIFQRDLLTKEECAEVIADYVAGFIVPPSPPADDNATAFPEYRARVPFLFSAQFKELVEKADVVLTLPVDGRGKPGIAFGRKLFERIASGEMEDHEVTGVVFRIDWDTDEPEALCAGLQLLRGRSDMWTE